MTAVSTMHSLSPIAVNRGFIDRKSVHAFFGQMPQYTEPGQVRHYSGTLFARLVRLSLPWHTKHIPLRVVCGMCGNTLGYTKCTFSNAGHMSYEPRWPYLIDVATLKQHADEILAIECRGADVFRHNLRLLLDNL